MGSKGGSRGTSGTQTVVQENQPNPDVQAAYNYLTGRAQDVSVRPLQQYGLGQPDAWIAGFNPSQTSAMDQIGSLAGTNALYSLAAMPGADLTLAGQQFQNATGTNFWGSLPRFDPSNWLAQQALGNLSQSGIYGQQGAGQPIAAAASPYAQAAAGQPIAATASPYAQAAAGQQIAALASPYAQAGAALGSNLQGQISPDVAMAINAARGLSGQVAPGAGIAAGAAQGLDISQAISPALRGLNVPGYNVDPYLGSYTQNVTNALQNLFNQQNAVQQQQVAGSTVGAGAYGGDRQAVAQALTAQQQQLAQAPVLAQVQQQGFQQAQQELNVQQQLALQRGVAQGQLGLGAAQALTGQAQTQGDLGVRLGQLGLQTGTSAGQLALGAAGVENQAAQIGAQANISAGQLMAGAAGQQGQLELGGGQLLANALQQQGQLNLGGGQLMAGAYGQQGQLGLGAGQLNLGLGQAAMSEFNQQQQAQLAAEQANAWLASSSGFGFGNLGQEAQGLFLGSQQAQLQEGALQQQLAQARLNLAPIQFQQQQNYPYQQLDFLAPIIEATGSLQGGTASTTSPGPGLGGQLAGLGTAGIGAAGLLNQTGAFTPGTGWLTGAQTGLWGSLFGGGGAGSIDAITGAGLQDLFATSPAAFGLGQILPEAAAVAVARGGRVGFQQGGPADPPEQEVPPGLAPARRFQQGGTFQTPPLPKIPIIGLDSIIPPGPATIHGEGPPRPPPPPAPEQAPTMMQDLQTAAQAIKLGGFGKDGSQPSQVSSRGGMVGLPHLGGIGGGGFGGSGFHMSGMPHTSLSHMGFGRPHLQGGGMDQPLTAAAPLSGVSPNVQSMFQQFETYPLEKLQELALRVPPGTAQGQLIQRALQAKRMTPGAGAGPTLPMAPAQTSYLPFQPSATGGLPTAQFAPSTFSNPGVGLAEGGGVPDYVTEDEIDPHPVVDHSGDTVVVHYPSEGRSLDLGIPSLRHKAHKVGGRIGLQEGGSDAGDPLGFTRSVVVSPRGQAFTVPMRSHYDAPSSTPPDLETTRDAPGLGAPPPSTPPDLETTRDAPGLGPLPPGLGAQPHIASSKKDDEVLPPPAATTPPSPQPSVISASAPIGGGGLGATLPGIDQEIEKILRSSAKGSEVYASPWMAVLGAGLGMMASPSPWAPQQIGQGGLEGLKLLAQQQKELPENELRRAQATAAMVGTAMLPYQMRAISEATGAPPTGAQPGSTVAPMGDLASAGSAGPSHQLGPLAPVAIGALKQAGWGDAPIQAALAAGLGEGGFKNPWQKSTVKDENSWGHWQLSDKGELPGYQAWVQGKGDPHGTEQQAQYLAYRMEQIHPGFGQISDPRQALDLINTQFERYAGAAPGQRTDQLAEVQKALGAPRPVQLAQAGPITLTDASPAARQLSGLGLPVPPNMGQQNADPRFQQLDRQYQQIGQDIAKVRAIAPYYPQKYEENARTIAQLTETYTRVMMGDPRMKGLAAQLEAEGKLPSQMAETQYRTNEALREASGKTALELNPYEVALPNNAGTMTLQAPRSQVLAQTAPGLPGNPMTGDKIFPSGPPATEGGKYDPTPESLIPVAPPPGTTALKIEHSEAAKGKLADDYKTLDLYRKQAADTPMQLERTGQLKALLDQYHTGKLADAGYNMMAWARSLGVPVAPEYDPSKNEEINKLATQLVFNQIKQIGGRVLVSEIEGLSRANPNTALTPEANRAILENVALEQNMAQDRFLNASKVFSKYKQLGDFDQRYIENTPVKTIEQNIRQFVHSGQSSPDELPEQYRGTAHLGADGRWYVPVEGGWAPIIRQR
jgi:hypothetical protein